MSERKPLPPLETLRAILRYDSSSGDLFWLERPANMFPAARHAGMWNTRFAGKQAFNIQHHAGYLYGGLFGSNFSTHRIAWYLFHGEVPDEIDHINGDRSDNRIINLRNVTRLENCKNKKIHKRSKSGVYGITWDPVNSKWHARVGKTHIGRFRDFEEAVAARDLAAAAKDYHPNHGRK